MGTIRSKTICFALILASIAGLQAHAGAVYRLFYGGDTNVYPYEIAGTAVADLTNNVNFPQNPVASEFLDDQLEGASSWGFNYGSQFAGLLEPPQTGSYTFWIASSDDSQLWLSSDETAGHRQLIAFVTGKTGPRLWSIYSSQQSAPITLMQGQVYYFQVLQKAGAGNDNVSIGWRLPDGALELPIAAYHAQPYTNAVVEPQIIQSPVDTNVVENSVVVFTITMNPSATPNTYQWYQGATPIPFATQSAYAKRVKLFDDGKRFSCAVNGALTSAAATLRVTADTTVPTILFAGPKGNPYAVTVQYSKEIDAESALNPAHYQLDHGAVVMGVFQSAPDTVILTTALHPGLPYTLTVNRVHDTAATPNHIAADTKAYFVLTDGGIQVKFWDHIAGANQDAINNSLGLLAQPPARALFNTCFETPAWESGDYYLGQIAGYIVPPFSGDYVFAIAADESGLLYLSTDDQPANKTRIAAVSNNATGPREFTLSPDQVSSPITLTAGKKYYLEALWKEGAGGDGVSVAWQLPGSKPITNNTPPIPGEYLSACKTPGPVVITNQPNRAFRALEGQSITIDVGPDGVDGSPLYSFQWLKNGAVIPGANSNYYTTPPLTLDDQGATFVLAVSNRFSATTSCATTLTKVDADLIPPALLGAGALSPPQFTVFFSKPLLPASATNLANFALYDTSGHTVTLTNPILSVTADSVTFTAASLTVGAAYTLTVNNIIDRTYHGNRLSNASAVFTPDNLAIVNINNPQKYAVNATDRTIAIEAGGADIGGNSDQFVFVYTIVNGDFDYRLQVRSLAPSDLWAMCGIMARESLAAGSRHLFNYVTPPDGNPYCHAQGRGNLDDASFIDPIGPAAHYPNAWLRLERIGQVFNFYGGNDGLNWTLFASHDTATDPSFNDRPLPDTMLVGIATTSHNPNQTTTSVVRDFGPTPFVPITITQQPPTSLVLVQNQPLTILARAEGSSLGYQWLKDEAVIDRATNAVYQVPWSSFTDSGVYQLRVFNKQFNVLSAPCTVTIDARTSGPMATSVVGSRFFNTMTISFDEPLDVNSATNPANYVVSGGVTVLGASVDSQTNVLLTTSTQTQGASYSVTVENVQDLLGNTMSDVTLNFTSFVPSPGYLESDQWLFPGDGAGQDSVDLLTGSPDFPSHPARVQLLASFNSLANSVGEGADNDGRRIIGWFIPDESTGYHFFLRSDAASELWISTDDTTNQWFRVAEETGCCHPFLEPGAAQTTVEPLSMIKGQPYAIMALQKNGDGHDYVQVAFRKTNDVTAASDLTPIPSRYLATYANPDVADITFVSQPRNVELLEFRNATFYVDVRTRSEAGTNVLCYQWQRNGQNIAGATNADYITPLLTREDNAASFACLVSVPGKTATSAPATITVLNDTVPPNLLSAVSLAGNGEVDLWFDEVLDAVSAETITNYTVSSGTITKAALATNGIFPGTIVVLTATDLEKDRVNITVSHVKDLAGNALATPTVVTAPQVHLRGIDVGSASVPDPKYPGLIYGTSAQDYQVIAGGSDIGSTADGFYFVYQFVNGDFDARVRVENLVAPDPGSKAGLMLREDLGAANRYFAVLAAATNGANLITSQWRDATGAISCALPNTQPVCPAYPNAWLRLKRLGDTCYAYWGTNGVDWVPLATNAPAVFYPQTLYVGLATTAHNNSSAAQTTVQYRQLVIATSLSTNDPPSKASIARLASSPVITWTNGILQKADNIGGPWSDIPEAVSPYAVPTISARQFYRLHN